MAPSRHSGPRILLLVSALCGFSLCGGCRNLQSTSNQSRKSALRNIYDEDQQNKDQDARRLLQDQVRQLIAEGKVQTGEDYYYAAFIFQHGQKPDEYLYAHVLATTALGKGFAPAKWLSAATLDRYLRSIKQPQVFGTQFGSLVDDDDMDPYNKDLLSDKIREMWCVAPLSKQLKIVEDIKAGREFTTTRTCPIPE